jgi:hypothetical protein
LTKAPRCGKILSFWRGSSTVEQWTHKPLVVGSNPTLATIENKNLSIGQVFVFLPNLYLSQAERIIFKDQFYEMNR